MYRDVKLSCSQKFPPLGVLICVVVSVPDYFWLCMSPFYQLSWYSHTACEEEEEEEEGGGEEGVQMSVLGDGGSRSARREPQASHMLLTTFSHMENQIGENLLELGWPQREMDFAHLLTPGENSSSTEIRTHNQT